jgi:hypothetical protein
VSYTVGGTATSGADYLDLGTNVVFAAGSATATQTVSVLDDTLVEGDETEVLSLVGGEGYTVGSPGSATVTIKDDDGSGCTPVNLVTGVTLGWPGNDFTGWQGLRLRVGTNPLAVQSLGRIYLSGNTQNHELRLVEVASGSTVASVIWTPAGGVDKQIKYVALAAPVTLAANAEYNLASQESLGGDRWYNSSTVVSTTSAGAVSSAVYSSNGKIWQTTGSAGHTYGPVSLQYCETSKVLEAPPLLRITGITMLAEGRVRLSVSGGSGQRCSILASEDLTSWQVVGEAVLTHEGSVEFIDADAGRLSSRYYRLATP